MIKILVIGELCVDRFVYGEVGKCQERVQRLQSYSKDTYTHIQYMHIHIYPYTYTQTTQSIEHSAENRRE